MADSSDSTERSDTADTDNDHDSVPASKVPLIPWWAWLGMGALVGATITAAILLLVILVKLEDDIQVLHHAVCMLSLSDGHLVASCNRVRG